MNKKFFNFDIRPADVAYIEPMQAISDKRCSVTIDGEIQNVGMIPGLCDAAVLLAERELLEEGNITEAQCHFTHIAIGAATTEKGMEAVYVEYECDGRRIPGDLLQLAVYDPSSGSLRAAIQPNATPGVLKTMKFDGTKKDIITRCEAAWMALLIDLLGRLPSAHEAFDKLKEVILGTSGGSPEDGFQCLAVLCWHMYQQLVKEEVNPMLLNLDDDDTQFKALKKDLIESGELSPQKGKRRYAAKFKIFAEGRQNKEENLTTVDWSSFESLPWERSISEFTKEELDRIPEIDPFETPTRTMLGILSEFKRTLTKERSLRSTRFILEGGSGSGKTYTVRSIAAHLHRPYVTHVCGATDGPDEFLGVIIPYVMNDGKKEYQLPEAELERLRSNPNFLWPEDLEMDIEFDSENAVGKVRSLYKKLVALVLSKPEENAKSEGIQYEYIPTNIVWAAQHGACLEIQEPTLLANQNALSVLYDALDKGSPGYIKTPIGEMKCSNDFTVFFTQNRKYKGTKPLNEAARSRMTHVEKMDDPSALEIMQRLGKRCSVTDQDLLKKVTDVYFALKEKAEDLNTDGVLTLRHLQDFLDAINDGVDLKWAFERKLLWPITTDTGDCEDLKLSVEDCELFEDCAING